MCDDYTDPLGIETNLESLENANYIKLIEIAEGIIPATLEEQKEAQRIINSIKDDIGADGYPED